MHRTDLPFPLLSYPVLLSHVPLELRFYLYYHFEPWINPVYIPKDFWSLLIYLKI